MRHGTAVDRVRQRRRYVFVQQRSRPDTIEGRFHHGAAAYNASGTNPACRVIIQRNFLPSALPKGTDIAELTSRIMGPLSAVIEQSGIEQDDALALRVHLDWIQYKSSSREPVTARRAFDRDEQPLPLSEISIDLRHVTAEKTL